MAPQLGNPKYVRFTTFRKNGDAVPTPVWFALDADGTYVFRTDADSGKVKRMRHTPRVEVAASDVRGRVADGAPTYTGTAEIIEDPAAMAPAEQVMATKYGLMWKLIGLGGAFQRLIGRTTTASAVIRVTLGDSAE